VTFAAPLLLAGLARPATRPAALALLLSAPADEWRMARPPLDLLRWTAASLADDVAYGGGVVVGCRATRTWEPLVPTRACRR
jgi:hypothetical protein